MGKFEGPKVKGLIYSGIYRERRDDYERGIDRRQIITRVIIRRKDNIGIA
jgi:hypothetical protein